MENLTDEQLSERFDDIEAVLKRLRRSELRAQQAQQRAQQAEQQAQQRAQQAEEQAQQAQQRAQHVLRTAEFAVLAACEVLMSSGRFRLLVATTDRNTLMTAMRNVNAEAVTPQEQRALEIIRGWLGLEVQPMQGNAFMINSGALA